MTEQKTQTNQKKQFKPRNNQNKSFKPNGKKPFKGKQKGKGKKKPQIKPVLTQEQHQMLTTLNAVFANAERNLPLEYRQLEQIGSSKVKFNVTKEKVVYQFKNKSGREIVLTFDQPIKAAFWTLRRLETLARFKKDALVKNQAKQRLNAFYTELNKLNQQ